MVMNLLHHRTEMPVLMRTFPGVTVGTCCSMQVSGGQGAAGGVRRGGGAGWRQVWSACAQYQGSGCSGWGQGGVRTCICMF